ncbi:hypothetical protein WICMUC_001451 [Wickerhamomyces mucosus]|uniref:Translation machinery-associated protein 16 n=1 Tax=Wickerhamomyces mucosus TaxID=1378264 RepID=A0A9P8PWA3_9ASCO|nr:hypothetical protein WICMUC_001451 [Wickerhamomyces mucosus]
MPIQHSLAKVTKSIQKSKGTVHPKGRKIKQINRATLREQKINNKKAAHLERKEHELQRTLFMQEAILHREDQISFTLEEIKSLIESFLSRDDEELDKLKAERRKGRPPTNRQSILENKKKHEFAEYESGYLVPNLNDEKTVENLRAWNRTTGGLNVVKFIHISKFSNEIPTSSTLTVNTDDAMKE